MVPSFPMAFDRSTSIGTRGGSNSELRSAAPAGDNPDNISASVLLNVRTGAAGAAAESKAFTS